MKKHGFVFGLLALFSVFILAGCQDMPLNGNLDIKDLTVEGIEDARVDSNLNQLSFSVKNEVESFDVTKIKAPVKTDSIYCEDLVGNRLGDTLELKEGINLFTLVFEVGEMKATWTLSIERLKKEAPLKTLEAIEMKSYASDYMLNDDFKSAIITAKYSDGSTSDITVTKEMLKNFDTKTAGKKTVSVEYMGKTTAFDIIVLGKSIEGISISSFEASYELNEEFKGAKLLVNYSDGTNETFDVEANMLKGFETETPGKKLITVSFANKTTTFEILVKAPAKAIKLEVVSFDGKYEINDEFKGARLKVIYSDSTTKEVDATLLMLTGFDTATAGKKTIKVEYEGVSTTFEILVKEPLKATKLEVLSFEASYDIADEFKGARLRVSYNDGTTKEVDATLEMLTGFNTSEAGKKTVTVTYDGVSTTFEINVKENIVMTGIKVITFEKDYKHHEAFKGATIEVQFSNNTKKNVTVTKEMLKNFSTEVCGSVEVTVIYSDFSATFTINVVKTVESIEAVNPKTDYYVGDPFVPFKLKVIYSDQSEEQIDVAIDMLTGFSTEASATKDVTITYNEKTCQFTINVYDKPVYTLTEVKLEYQLGEEFYAKVLVTQGEKEREILVTKEMITGFNNKEIGEYDVVIRINDFTQTVHVTVKELEIKDDTLKDALAAMSALTSLEYGMDIDKRFKEFYDGYLVDINNSPKEYQQIKEYTKTLGVTESQVQSLTKLVKEDAIYFTKILFRADMNAGGDPMPALMEILSTLTKEEIETLQSSIAKALAIFTDEQIAGLCADLQKQAIAENNSNTELYKYYSEAIKSYVHKSLDEIVALFGDEVLNNFVGFTRSAEALPKEKLVELIHAGREILDAISKVNALDIIATIDLFMNFQGFEAGIDGIHAAARIVKEVTNRAAAVDTFGKFIEEHVTTYDNNYIVEAFYANLAGAAFRSLFKNMNRIAAYVESIDAVMLHALDVFMDFMENGTENEETYPSIVRVVSAMNDIIAFITNDGVDDEYFQVLYAFMSGDMLDDEIISKQLQLIRACAKLDPNKVLTDLEKEDLMNCFMGFAGPEFRLNLQYIDYNDTIVLLRNSNYDEFMTIFNKSFRGANINGMPAKLNLDALKLQIENALKNTGIQRIKITGATETGEIASAYLYFIVVNSLDEIKPFGGSAVVDNLDYLLYINSQNEVLAYGYLDMYAPNLETYGPQGDLNKMYSNMRQYFYIENYHYMVSTRLNSIATGYELKPLAADRIGLIELIIHTIYGDIIRIMHYTLVDNDSYTVDFYELNGRMNVIPYGYDGWMHISLNLGFIRLDGEINEFGIDTLVLGKQTARYTIPETNKVITFEVEVVSKAGLNEIVDIKQIEFMVKDIPNEVLKHPNNRFVVRLKSGRDTRKTLNELIADLKNQAKAEQIELSAEYLQEASYGMGIYKLTVMADGVLYKEYTVSAKNIQLDEYERIRIYIEGSNFEISREKLEEYLALPEASQRELAKDLIETSHWRFDSYKYGNYFSDINRSESIFAILENLGLAYTIGIEATENYLLFNLTVLDYTTDKFGYYEREYNRAKLQGIHLIPTYHDSLEYGINDLQTEEQLLNAFFDEVNLCLFYPAPIELNRSEGLAFIKATEHKVSLQYLYDAYRIVIELPAYNEKIEHQIRVVTNEKYEVRVNVNGTMYFVTDKVTEKDLKAIVDRGMIQIELAYNINEPMEIINRKIKGYKVLSTQIMGNQLEIEFEFIVAGVPFVTRFTALYEQPNPDMVHIYNNSKFIFVEDILNPTIDEILPQLTLSYDDGLLYGVTNEFLKAHFTFELMNEKNYVALRYTNNATQYEDSFVLDLKSNKEKMEIRNLDIRFDHRTAFNGATVVLTYDAPDYNEMELIKNSIYMIVLYDNVGTEYRYYRNNLDELFTNYKIELTDSEDGLRELVVNGRNTGYKFKLIAKSYPYGFVSLTTGKKLVSYKLDNRGNDTFLVYAPVINDYIELLKNNIGGVVYDDIYGRHLADTKEEINEVFKNLNITYKVIDPLDQDVTTVEYTIYAKNSIYQIVVSYTTVANKIASSYVQPTMSGKLYTHVTDDDIVNEIAKIVIFYANGTVNEITDKTEIRANLGEYNIYAREDRFDIYLKGLGAELRLRKDPTVTYYMVDYNGTLTVYNELKLEYIKAGLKDGCLNAHFYYDNIDFRLNERPEVIETAVLKTFDSMNFTIEVTCERVPYELIYQYEVVNSDVNIELSLPNSVIVKDINNPTISEILLEAHARIKDDGRSGFIYGYPVELIGNHYTLDIVKTEKDREYNIKISDKSGSYHIRTISVLTEAEKDIPTLVEIDFLSRPTLVDGVEKYYVYTNELKNIYYIEDALNGLEFINVMFYDGRGKNFNKQYANNIIDVLEYAPNLFTLAQTGANECELTVNSIIKNTYKLVFTTNNFMVDAKFNTNYLSEVNMFTELDMINSMRDFQAVFLNGEVSNITDSSQYLLYLGAYTLDYKWDHIYVHFENASNPLSIPVRRGSMKLNPAVLTAPLYDNNLSNDVYDMIQDGRIELSFTFNGGLNGADSIKLYPKNIRIKEVRKLDSNQCNLSFTYFDEQYNVVLNTTPAVI